MKQKGLLVCITGMDGSGKTTQAKRLVEYLQSQGYPALYVWSRGEEHIRKVFLRMGRWALGASKHDLDTDHNAYQKYQNGKKKLFKNPLVRLVWTALVRGEHLKQIAHEVTPALKNGSLVVCDRYIWDSTIDLAIALGKSPDWLYDRDNRITWSLVPQPAITFYIRIPAAEAFRRKNDIPSFEYVQLRESYYQVIPQCVPVMVLDGCASPDDIFDRITNALQPYLSRHEQSHGAPAANAPEGETR